MPSSNWSSLNAYRYFFGLVDNQIWCDNQHQQNPTHHRSSILAKSKHQPATSTDNWVDWSTLQKLRNLMIKSQKLKNLMTDIIILFWLSRLSDVMWFHINKIQHINTHLYLTLLFSFDLVDYYMWCDSTLTKSNTSTLIYICKTDTSTYHVSEQLS